VEITAVSVGDARVGDGGESDGVRGTSGAPHDATMREKKIAKMIIRRIGRIVLLSPRFVNDASLKH
jgi:hypothetical protein